MKEAVERRKQSSQEKEAGLSPDCFQQGEELLTQTEDIVSRWKKHFDKHLNLTDLSSIEEAELEYSVEDMLISLAEVTEGVSSLLSCGSRVQNLCTGRPSRWFTFLTRGGKIQPES